MKLTEIAIHGPATRPLHLQRLSDGLNVVFSRNTDVGDQIAQFIHEVLFGHQREWTSQPGYLQIDSGGHAYRLARPHSHPAGELAISDAQGHSLNHRTPGWLSSIDPLAWNKLFQVALGNHPPASQRDFFGYLLHHFEMDPGGPVTPGSTMPFAPDQASYRAWRTAADARLARLETVRSELDVLQSERQRLIDAQTHEQREQRDRLVSIEHELAVLQSEWDALQLRIQGERSRLAELDREIAELSTQLERIQSGAKHVPLARPQSGQLLLVYERLDEIDNQIRCWRSLQNEIQQQRLKLRDEMTATSQISIESPNHPYHEARKILAALEQRVKHTDQFVRGLDSTVTSGTQAREIGSMCHEMRDDLQALCNELGQQYTHVRHRAAVAELKQLRRCYHEIDENIQRLLDRRQSLLGEIHGMDPSGAQFIERGDPAFLAYAEQEGYVAARNRYLSDVPDWQPDLTTVEHQTVTPDVGALQQRLAELHSARSGIAGELRHLEQKSDDVQPRRVMLINNRNEVNCQLAEGHRQRLQEIETRQATLTRELQSLEQQVQADRPWYQWKPDYFLTDAARHLSRLTEGRWSQIVLDASLRCWLGAPGRTRQELTVVSTADQSMTRLCLCLAAVSQLALRGIRIPMVITDRLVGDESQTVFETLESFCRHGHQVLLVTGSRAIEQLGRQQGLGVYELPDTEIITPSWFPDPAIPRSDCPDIPAQTGVDVAHRPAANAWRSSPIANHYPVPAGVQMATPLARHEYPTAPIRPSGEVRRSAAPEIKTGTEVWSLALADVDLVESIYLTALGSVGVHTIGELMNLDLEREGPELVNRGFSREQLQRWQSQAWLLISVPQMSARHARVLSGCGIADPESLERIDAADVVEQVRQFLASPAGRRSGATSGEFDLAQVRRWAEQLRNDPTWRKWRPARHIRNQTSHTRREQTSRVHREQIAMPRPASYRSSRREQDATRQDSRSTGSTRTRSATAVSDESRYRYYLQLTDDLHSAPSIGPKSAERFRNIGVQSVQDFIDADPAQMAAKLDNRRMSARVIGAWQNQSRLMCQVPNLRGHDAQLLVGCGITESQSLAGMNANDLLAKVAPFADSKEGARILRNSKAPDLDEVTGWIDAAHHGRALKAA